MDKKLRVSLKVFASGGMSSSGKKVLDFSGDTELGVPELRKVLSYLITGEGEVTDAFTASEKSEPKVHLPGESSDLTNSVAAVMEGITVRGASGTPDAPINGEHIAGLFEREPEKKRRKPRGKTPLVCHRCGRPFKGLSKLQKYCHKKDCEAVAAANFVAESVRANRSSQRGLPKNYPKTRAKTTPRTAAVCQRCGRPYMAYTKLQKYCGKEDCFEAAAVRASSGWTPQVTIEAGKGVRRGTV